MNIGHAREKVMGWWKAKVEGGEMDSAEEFWPAFDQVVNACPRDEAEMALLETHRKKKGTQP